MGRAEKQVNEFAAWLEETSRPWTIARDAVVRRAEELADAEADLASLTQLRAAVNEMRRQEEIMRGKEFPGFAPTEGEGGEDGS